MKLYENKKDCCACGACKNVCPVNAIEMKCDEYGFLYPHINNELCIECGACKKVCTFQNGIKKNVVKETYAAACVDDNIIKKSSSGGIFSILANEIINQNGAVYGVALEYEDGKLRNRHIRVETKKDIDRLRGSKYIQSNINGVYKKVKEDLENNTPVLFSGVPCQIAGLYGFLRKDYEKLITVEVICHGVPSEKFFQDFIEYEREKRKVKAITGFSFRDKSKGQGMRSRFDMINKKDVKIQKVVNGKTLSYFSVFLKSQSYRSSCYTCPYATHKRCADITLGDFWGFHAEHKTIPKDINLSNSKGVSCLLLNTKKAKAIFSNTKEDLILLKSSFDKVAKHNTQLRQASTEPKERDIILNLYKDLGYEAVHKYYIKNNKRSIFLNWLQELVPKKVKRIIIGLIK